MPWNWELWASLPNDIVRLILRKHWDFFYGKTLVKIRHARRQVILELEDAFDLARYRYWRELMDTENGGYGYMLDADGIDEELDDYLTWNWRAIKDAIENPNDTPPSTP